LYETCVLKDKTIEIKAKYLYMYLTGIIETTGDSGELTISAQDLSCALGVSLAMLYRARSILVNLGIIKYTKKYCENTGKKVSDQYSAREPRH